MLSDFAQSLVMLLTFQAPPTVYLVHLAMLSYAAGFLFRSQIMLRGLVLMGSAFYIAYYALHPATPLWDAIFASMVIGTANMIGLARLLVDRLPFGMGRAGEVMTAFDTIAPGTMRPGGVRRIMRLAEIREACGTTALIRAGVRPEALFLLTEGAARIEKDGVHHRVAAPCFLGEIAFITQDAASADVTVAPGSRYVAWAPTGLHARMEASAEIDRGLRALISYDLARKLAASVPVLAQAQGPHVDGPVFANDHGPPPNPAANAPAVSVPTANAGTVWAAGGLRALGGPTN